MLRQARACATADRMYVTALPAIPTLTMAEIQIETNSIGLQLQAACVNVGMSKRTYHKHDPAPFPSTIGARPRHVTFLTTKTAVRKNQENNGQMGPVLGQGSACAKGGGGFIPYGWRCVLSLATHVYPLPGV